MFILREAKVQIVDRIYLGISICFISLVPFAACPPFVFNKYIYTNLKPSFAFWTAVARGPKRIVFTNFLTFRAENLAGTFFISQREAGRPVHTRFDMAIISGHFQVPLGLKTKRATFKV